MIPSSPLSSSSSSLRRYRYRPSSDGGGLGRGHVLVPDCDPRGSPTRTLPPRRRDTPKVTRPSFWILEGHGWVRCDIGSREATPISVFSERGHPAFTSATPSPPDHFRLTASPVVTDVVSVSSLPSTFTPCRLAVGHVACLSRSSRRRLAVRVALA